MAPFWKMGPLGHLIHKVGMRLSGFPASYLGSLKDAWMPSDLSKIFMNFPYVTNLDFH